MTSIADQLKALDHKIDAVAADNGVADVSYDGLFDKQEAAAMITGLVGGKGQLPDGTDFNDVDHGGVYYAPSEGVTYKNVPFGPLDGSNYRMMLTVIKNFGQNPRTQDPLLYQRVDTIELSGKVQTAYRFKYGGKWLKWYYPAGVTLWSGHQVTGGTTFTLAQDYTDFTTVKIYWNPFQSANNTHESLASVDGFVLTYNAAPTATTANPVATMEKINLKASTDHKSLTSSGVFFELQGSLANDQSNAGKSEIVKIVGY